MAPRRPWSSLPEELLELIFKRSTMDEADLLRSRDVCVSWRSIIKNLFGKELLVAQLLSPLLFFPNKTSNSGFHTNATDFYRFGFPFTHGNRFFMYSSRGWLLSSARDQIRSDLQLLNPFSGAKIQLPSTRPRDFECPFKFILSGSPLNQSCIILLLDRYKRQIAFCSPGDTSWNYIHCLAHYDDVIFFKNQFYVSQDGGCFSKIYLDTKHVTALAFSPLKSETNRRYLVESLCGTLLMVLRYKYWEKVSLDTASYKTTMFKVLSLDWKKKEWNKLETLGNQALFLAHNDSRIVSTENCTMYKQNCIYFVDDSMEGSKSQGTDFGVFDMENKTIEKFYSVPFNRWFKPDI